MKEERKFLNCPHFSFTSIPMAKTRLERERDREFRSNVRKKVRGNTISIIFLMVCVVALAIALTTTLF
jgi:hypothetical protein